MKKEKQFFKAAKGQEKPKKEKARSHTKGAKMRTILILFAIVPMLCTAGIMSALLVTSSSSELQKSTKNSMKSMVEGIGTAFDYAAASSENSLQAFAQSPIVLERLKYTTNQELDRRAQQYTKDYFAELFGWEGIYIADWDTNVLTHSSEAAVGMVLREGDNLTELQDMLTSTEGVYNFGIMKSPASGEFVMSMYMPVYDGNTPIGFVGGGVFIADLIEQFARVSSLGLDSAYLYMVDSSGTMLYHPDATKLGLPVENAAVKSIISRMHAGEHPQPETIEDRFRGTNKYASFYVSENNAYISVVTADESDVMSVVNTFVVVTVVMCVVCVLLFALVAIFVARKVSKPLTGVTQAAEILSTGDVVTVNEIKSNIRETTGIIVAFQKLRGALLSSISNVKESATALDTAIVTVDEMTTKNVDEVSKISAAIDGVASTSQVVAENAQNMAEKASMLGDEIEGLNENVQVLFEASQIIGNANEVATDCMKSVYIGANESVEAMQNISEKITETNDAISGIISAVQAIESIAAQTNLLSLNASIEAARAGEAGRGFAVVANEIRSLADSSAMSAKEIKQIVENVIELSAKTVEISDRVFQVVQKEQADIEMTQGKFTELSDSVEASRQVIETIRTMTDKLEGIKTELMGATNDLGAVSEELGASAQEVAASCQMVSTACVDTQASTEEMRAINENLGEAISFFKV